MYDFNYWNAEPGLYYLYMMADGEISPKEKKVFRKICKELEFDSDRKKSLMEMCERLVDEEPDVLEIITEAEIDEKAGKRMWMGTHSSRERIIWNLINLGYSDSAYSEEEKKIVNYLVDKWSIDNDVYQEFIDTAETMLALTRQKEWIISTFTDDIVQNEKKKKVDRVLNQLQSDIKVTLAEAEL